MTPEQYTLVMSSHWEVIRCTCDNCRDMWLVTINASPGLVVASNACQDVAQHIAATHNAWLLDLDELIQES